MSAGRRLLLPIRPAAGSLALLALLCAAVATAPSAQAGNYVVYQCWQSYFGALLSNSEHNFQWAGTIGGAGHPSVTAHGGSGCGGEFGLAVQNGLNNQAVTHASGAYGGYFYYAPNGTYFIQASGYFGILQGTTGGTNMYTTAVAAQNQNGSGVIHRLVTGNVGMANTWNAGWPTYRRWDGWASGLAAAKRVGFYIECSPGPCSQSQWGDLRMRARDFIFLVSDSVAPSAGAVTGTLTSTGWHRGTKTLGIQASDQGGGIKATAIDIVDSANQALKLRATEWSNPGCAIGGEAGGGTPAYYRMIPCPLSHSPTWSVNTAALPDGDHVAVFHAFDVGDLYGISSRTFNVDNTPPVPPTNLCARPTTGGTCVADIDWQDASPNFTLQWTNPGGQFAPLSRLHYERCPVIPAGSCTTGSQTGTTSMSLSGLQWGQRQRVRVWLEDSAGNVNTNTSARSNWAYVSYGFPPGVDPELDVEPEEGESLWQLRELFDQVPAR